MKIRTLTLLTSLLFLFLISCSKDHSTSGFTVNGIAKNIPDSTYIVLYDDNVSIDSAIILDEKFSLSGSVEHPKNVFLVINKTGDYKPLWLENTEINFSAEKGDFRNAKISGTEIQKEEDILNNRLQALKEAEDHLVAILRDRNTSSERRDSLFTLYNENNQQQAKMYKDFIKEFPGSYVSAHILNVYKKTWKKEKVVDLFDKISPEIRQSKYGKSIARFIELNKNPQIGEPYVDFEQANPEGQLIRLSDERGKYTLIEFWASWCGPCRVSNPELVKLYKEYNDKGFEIFGVSFDKDKERWIRAIKKDSLHWQNVSDLKGSENEAGLIYGVNGIPDNVLIDENGIIIGRTLRGKALEDKLKEVIDDEVAM